MLGELLSEIAQDVLGDVAPFAAGIGGELVKSGVDFAVDKFNDIQKMKTIKECLGVENDIYFNDAVAYWELLDNINSSSFEGLKKQLMKI
jgi:hypothetical protein